MAKQRPRDMFIDELSGRHAGYVAAKDIERRVYTEAIMSAVLLRRIVGSLLLQDKGEESTGLLLAKAKSLLIYIETGELDGWIKGNQICPLFDGLHVIEPRSLKDRQDLIEERAKAKPPAKKPKRKAGR